MSGRAFAAVMRRGHIACVSELIIPYIKAYLKTMAEPLQWIKDGNDPYVNAFFGSREAWEGIPNWDGAPIKRAASDAPASHPVGRADQMDIAGLRDFAALRGGSLESASVDSPAHRLHWTCAQGHAFEASPNLLVGAGYWCPTCAPRVEDTSGWDFQAQSQQDRLLAAYL